MQIPGSTNADTNMGRKISFASTLFKKAMPKNEIMKRKKITDLYKFIINENK